MMCLSKNIDMLDQFIRGAGDVPLIVTFKELEPRLKLRETGRNQLVAHFGGMRGSNVYRDCDAAILIGSYRLLVAFSQAIQKVSPEFDPMDFSLMTWHQDLFRTRIRNGTNRYGGSSTPDLKGQEAPGCSNDISVIVVGDKETTTSLSRWFEVSQVIRISVRSSSA